MHEVLNDLKLYPTLVIEPNLLLVYERDFILYLSRQGHYAHPEYLPLIETVLLEAKESGLIERMIYEYGGADLNALRYYERTVIPLNTPR